jgi:hypothetical protein
VNTRKIKLEAVSYLFAAMIVFISIVTMYLNMRNWIPQVQGDVFYDADSIRTLNYLQDVWSALSYIRPTLVFVALLGSPLAILLSPYIAWMIITLLSFLLLMYSLTKLIEVHKFLDNRFLLIAIVSNFAAVAFLFVPDTFIMSSAFFFFGIVVLEKRQTLPFIAASLLISCGTNLFFAIPWATYYFFRRFNDRRIMNFAIGGVIPLAALLAAQWVARKIAQISTLSTEIDSSANDSSTMNQNLSESGIQSFYSNSDALKWLHNPLDNLWMNILSYLSAPWTVNYHYEKGLIPQAESALPLAIILCGMALTLISFQALWRNRLQHKALVVLMFVTEASCVVLFLTYGPHPYLFSPFLIATRVVGLLFYVGGKKFLGPLLVAFVSMLNLLTQALVFL